MKSTLKCPFGSKSSDRNCPPHDPSPPTSPKNDFIFYYMYYNLGTVLLLTYIYPKIVLELIGSEK
jgi:hypothetical protein